MQKIKSKTNYNAIITALASLTALTPAFAATDMTKILKGAIASVQTTVTAIFNPLCVLALGICICILVMGRNSKSADSSMSWAKRIVICFVVFNMMGTLLAWVSGLFGDEVTVTT